MTKNKDTKATLRPLQYSAGLFVLEGVFRSLDAHEQRVVSGVFGAVGHQVCRGFGYLQEQEQAGIQSSWMHLHMLSQQLLQCLFGSKMDPFSRFKLHS